MQIYEFGNPDASVVLIEPIHTVEGMANEAEILRELSGDHFLLRAVTVDWFRDLTPWSAPPVFGDTAFGDGAQHTLDDGVLYGSRDAVQTFLHGIVGQSHEGCFDAFGGVYLHLHGYGLQTVEGGRI